MKIEELPEILGMDSITLKLEPQIYVRDFEKALVSDNWKKIYEDDTDYFSNFTVIYRKGNYEMSIFCDPDAYIVDITISKIREEGSEE